MKPKLLQLAGTLVVCSLCVAASSMGADVRGKITGVNDSDALDTCGFVRIEGAKEKDTNVDKAAVRVMGKTRIFKLQDGQKVKANFGNLKVGQTVEATFTGPVAESYPVQATAAEVVILEQPRADAQGTVVKGRIASIAESTAKGICGVIRVSGAAPGCEKAIIQLTVTDKTQFSDHTGAGRATTAFANLKVGQTVEARCSGRLAAVRMAGVDFIGTADEITILAEAVGGRARYDGPQPSAPQPEIKEGSEVTLVGALRGGMMAIGGETTGWVLSYKTSAGERQIEVDLSGLSVGRPVNGSVRVTGKVIKHNYVERGPTLILKAAKVEPIVAPAEQKPAAPATPPRTIAVPSPNIPPAGVLAVHKDELMKINGVVGVGLGKDAHGQFVIKVMVRDAEAAMNPRIPKTLEGVPVEVEVTGEIKAR